MKRLLLFSVVFIGFSYFSGSDAIAQGVGINSSGNPPDPSAALDVNLPNKGTLISRMTTTQRNAISNPAEGLMIFNTTTKCLEMYVNSAWYSASCPCPLPSEPTAGIHTTSQTNITWNWNAVLGATGYKWNTADNYSTATDNLTSTSYNQTGLTCNTSYSLYVWAYNGCGNSSSTILTQTTASCIATVTCGSQTFMAENLNVGTMVTSDGSHTGQQQTNNGITEKYCYNNNPANCTIYGALYEWYEAMGYNASVNCDPCGPTTGYGGVQGICPSGYHIPSDLELSRFEHCVETTISPTGSTSLSTFQTSTGWRGTTSGKKMKSNTGWDGSNLSGFNGLPSADRQNGSGNFQDFGTDGYFWTATESTGTSGLMHYQKSGSDASGRIGDPKLNGLGVRCLKD